MKDQELQNQIDCFLNETISDTGAKALEERLIDDVEARTHYLNEVGLHASLNRTFSVQKGTVVLPFERSFDPKVIYSLAACLVLFLGFCTYWFFSPPVARITHVVGAYNGNGIAYEEGESINQGGISLSRGLLRLDFSNGARVTLEGPADLEIHDVSRITLNAGILTANIPESAIGFTVDTEAAHVVDLGTSFGVSVGFEGLTEVCVFDGEVEVSPVGEYGSGNLTQLVREGEAISATINSSIIDSVSFETSQFENAWPVNYGVLQTTGSMRFVSPGPDFHPGNYKDNDHIVVFPEKRGFIAEESIRVDMIDPGEYQKSHYDEKPTLVPRRAMTSYLLQMDAYPEGKNPNRRRGAVGQITFARPIVGVVTEDRLLKESEIVFGIPGVEYPSARTIEPRPEGDKREGFDKLILTADRHSLILELRENPGHLDQVRVLVEAQ